MNTIEHVELMTTPKNLIKVLIVEDQEVLLMGLTFLLQNSPGIQMVGSAKDGPSAVSQALALEPDVILMDVALPGFDGIEATRQIKAKAKCRILILTTITTDKTIFSALEAGADGYCLKDVPSEKLHTAILSVANGGTWLDDEISLCILKSAKFSNSIVTSEQLTLSSEELQVLGLLLEGASSQEISEQIKQTEMEVQVYLKRLVQKVSLSEKIIKEPQRMARCSEGVKIAKQCPTCNLRLEERFTHCPYDNIELIYDKLVGTIFAERYEILSVLGSGTSGVVYKARHRYMQKLVAIKVMHLELISDLSLLKRFRLEAAAASNLNHPNIIDVTDFGLSPDGHAFMIMEFHGGESLESLIFKNVSIPTTLAMEIFKQICDALEHAHRYGIIHRDLKPSNVMVINFSTNDVLVKIVDFGTAKVSSEDSDRANLTSPGQIFGSPTYMSPEQCMGLTLAPSSDVYSMGTLMYETLVGHPPFITENVLEAMYKQINEDCPNIAKVASKASINIDLRLQRIVMKALNKDSQHRYQSFEELKKDLNAVI
ncbi:MAG: protein kinase [Leptolyngbya sp.]|nr:protein kinase [Candidatus Melainabacteria bacterium]